jgi:hypothetical protein
MFQPFWFLFCEAVEIGKNGDKISPFTFNALALISMDSFFLFPLVFGQRKAQLCERV